jgi:hypothetical protein
MPLNLASPGILIREVDLTIGRIDPVSASVGALVGPFAKGPVLEPKFIESENDLLNTFGKPYSVNKHYEHWMVASSYLAYGGVMQIVRTDDENLRTAFYGEAADLKVKSLEHYTELGYLDTPLTDVTVMAQNPGSWANGISVAMIDARADQILTGFNTTGVQVGYAVTQAINTVSPGAGTTTRLDGYLKGLITGIGAGTVDVKLLTHVSAAGTERPVDYQLRGVYNFADNGTVGIHTTNVSTAFTSRSYSVELDWFDQQTCLIGIQTTRNNTPSRVNWNALAPRPGTSEFAAERNSRFDEVHIVVIDAEGKITGNAGTILEKHLSLSKASDALYSSGSPSYWRKYLTTASEYIFAGSTPLGITTTGFSEAETYELSTDNDWDQETQDITFGCCGALDLPLTGGLNYDGGSDILAEGSLEVELGDIITACDEFLNEDEIDIDFLLMGSAGYDKTDCQAWASKMISVAEARKDTVAFISPYRGASITDTSSQTSTTIRDVDTITENVVSFYSPVPSTTYAVFDSGYKYMYDRFNNTFRYVPLNGDIAGTCARNDINNFPWYSPGGTTRGTILNAVKLAYNPGRKQRDRLYTNRINPVVVSPGAGIILFGDKTGYGKSSAFDRINVRRLFIYLENAIAFAAKDQLFEFNDEITRTNFVNIVEPFLRDVQSKRGIYDYVVICDETNNTPAIIDANEFIADIYIKPARTINFIGLTFIATRTGVAFEEVIGNF